MTLTIGSIRGSYDGSRWKTATPMTDSLRASPSPAKERSTAYFRNWLIRAEAANDGSARTRSSCWRTEELVGAGVESRVCGDGCKLMRTRSFWVVEAAPAPPRLTHYKPVLHSSIGARDRLVSVPVEGLLPTCPDRGTCAQNLLAYLASEIFTASSGVTPSAAQPKGPVLSGTPAGLPSESRLASRCRCQRTSADYGRPTETMNSAHAP